MKIRTRNTRVKVSNPAVIGARRLALVLGGAAMMIGLGALAQQGEPRARDNADLEIVDCKLPSQVRRLGANQIYQPPRRMVRLVARECVRRHGEYVAFDPANYRDALVLWLEDANDGVAAAQTQVGEFYEHGYGVAVDYAEAARWYGMAAEQDFARAQRNLAYLYEQGLGVERDEAAAINLYREASGIDDDDLVFESELVAARAESQRVIDNLTNQLEAQTEQVEALQGRLALTQQRLAQRRSDYEAVESEVRSLRGELTALRASDGGARRAELDELQARLDAREAELSRRMRDVADLEAEQAEQRASLTEELQRASRRDAELHSRLSEQSAELRSLREQLTDAQQAVYDAEQREAELLTALSSERRELSAERETGADAALAARERRIAEQQAQIDQLREQRREALVEVVELRERERELEQAHGDELASSRAEVASLEQRLVETDQHVTELSAELRRERERFENERERLAAREQQADSGQQAEIERLREELAGREARLADQQSDIDRLTAESRRLRNRIDELSEPPQVAMRGIPERSVAPRPLTAADIASSSRFVRDADLGEFHALVIGIGEYAELERLDTATSDAEAVAAVLEDKYGFKVRTLLNATSEDIMGALADYADTETTPLEESDSFLIYYAGHGEIDMRDSSGYWLPADARPDNRAGWITDQQIARYAGQFPARHVLVVADSCYSGVMTRQSTTRLAARNPEHWETLLLGLGKLRSRTVLTSGGEQPVLSGGGGEHSVFARELLDLLQRNDRVLDGTSLYSELFEGVRDAAAQFDIDQTPEYSEIANAGHGAGEFLFIPRS